MNTNNLPLPRLELRWIKNPNPPQDNYDNHYICYYELVLPLSEMDCRREQEDGTKLPYQRIIIGETHVSGGGNYLHEGVVDTPYRDGAHAQWDSKILNLPVFATCDEFATQIILKE